MPRMPNTEHANASYEGSTQQHHPLKGAEGLGKLEALKQTCSQASQCTFKRPPVHRLQLRELAKSQLGFGAVSLPDSTRMDLKPL